MKYVNVVSNFSQSQKVSTVTTEQLHFLISKKLATDIHPKT